MANGLRAVGPTDPVHGFPLWYEDADGVRLELGLDPTDPNLPALELPTPGAPVSFPDNFPDEAFYFLAEAEMLVGGPAGGARARLILALEAAFGGTGAVLDGQQMVFGRVRLRIDDVEPGATYTATHPYGVISGEADERGRVFETEDIGAPGDFTSPFASSIGPFLRWAANRPAGYLGDGVAERTVITGVAGPAGFFRLEGPGVGTGPTGPDPADPGNPNRAATALFTVQGKEAARFGATLERAVYTPAGPGVDVDVFVTSVPGQSLVVAGPGVPATALRSDGGRYVARVPAPAPPATITVTNTSDDPPFAVSARVTDAVSITGAAYDLDAAQLTVTAASSAGRPLTVEEFGQPPGAIPTAAPPAAVTVVSDAGGTATQAVTLTGAAFPAVPVVANAGVDRTVQQGQQVRLDGTGSVGATTFAWQQTAGPPVALTGGATATPSFDAPAAGSVLTFELTVTGPGGPQRDPVAVTVAALTPPAADAGADRDAPVGDPVHVSGAASTGAAAFAWTSDVPGLVLTGADTAEVGFVMPAQPVTLTLEVTGPGGAPDTDTVAVRPVLDTITPARVEFRTGRGQWRIEGTVSAALPDLVTARLGNGAGPQIGTVAADATREFDLRRDLGPADAALRPVPGAVVTLTSTRGGTRVVAVTVRS
jgi:hypothetical protein